MVRGDAKMKEKKPDPIEYPDELWEVPNYPETRMKVPVQYADIIRINTSYVKDKLIAEFIVFIDEYLSGDYADPEDLDIHYWNKIKRRLEELK